MKLALIALAAVCGLFAQDATIRVDVQQVVVPVIVADKSGHHVAGLKESDFRILEDGVPQKISSFSGGPSASGTYIFCVDTLHTSPTSAARIRDMLEKLFENAKSGDAQYALIGIGRQLRVLQTATSNPLEIVAKLRSPGFQQNFGGYDRSAFESQLNDVRRRMEEFCRRCSCSSRQLQSSCTGEMEGLKEAVETQAAPWIPLNHALAEQFRSVVEELGKIGTSRTLILVSDSFELDPKQEFYRAVSVYLSGQPQFELQESRDATLNAALKAAADKNIRIDTIDSRGGTPAPSLAAVDPMDAGASVPSTGEITLGISRPNANTSVRQTTLNRSTVQPLNTTQQADSTLAEIASLTGGTYSHGGDLLKEFRSATGDGRDFYVLTYVPTNSAQDGSFRHITVETPDKRLNIRAKSGYWAPVPAQ